MYATRARSGARPFRRFPFRSDVLTRGTELTIPNVSVTPYCPLPSLPASNTMHRIVSDDYSDMHKYESGSASGEVRLQVQYPFNWRPCQLPCNICTNGTFAKQKTCAAMYQTRPDVINSITNKRQHGLLRRRFRLFLQGWAWER